MTAATALTVVALVSSDPAVVRNAPRDDAPAQASVWRGDWLEVRGESAGFLRVYDHRHERPGFIRQGVVRVYRVDAGSAGELAAIVRFLRDAPGWESLGIAHAALALKVVPADSDTSELLASIGSMAERLALRLSARRAEARDATSAAHREVVESYGVTFKVVEAESLEQRARVCYDGDVWRRLVAAPGTAPAERARAALALAVDRCRSPLPSPADDRAWNDRRLEALRAVELSAASPAPPASLAAQVRLRRAEALAWRAFDEARRGGLDTAAPVAEAEAVRELALVERGALAPEDLALYDEVAVRVAASRWAAEAPPREAARDVGRRAVAVVVAPRAPGESCVRVVDPAGRTLGERCTYGVVWPSALRWSPSGTAAALAVQPLPAWTELWLLRRAADGASWTFETLTPATATPDVGYVEAAGFSPDGARLLVVREARVAGRLSREFQVLATPTLAVERWAASPDKLAAFKRWSAPSWRAGTLALR